MIDSDNMLILAAILVCAAVAVLSILRAPPVTRMRFTERERDEIRALIRHELLIEMALTGEQHLLERAQRNLQLEDAEQEELKAD